MLIAETDWPSLLVPVAAALVSGITGGGLGTWVISALKGRRDARNLDMQAVLNRVEGDRAALEGKVTRVEERADRQEAELGECRVDFATAVAWITHLETRLEEKQIPFRPWADFFQTMRPGRAGPVPAIPQPPKVEAKP